MICHGAGSQKENHADFARLAAANGWAALAFDARGHGESEGEMSAAAVDDVILMTRLLAAHEDCVRKGLEALRNTTDDFLATKWKLLVGGQVVMEDPRYKVVADTFTHLAHHRGQLTVYLRLNDIPVPSIYGPTADDKTF